MYVNNGEISSRQTFRLYVFDLMGIATLLLPPYLAQLCGIDGIWAILIGTGAGVLYLIYLGWVMKRMQMDACTYLRENTGVIFRFTTVGLVWLHSIITAGFCAYVFSNLMQHTLVRESKFWIILFVIVLVAAYAVSGGIESRARVYEVLFLPVLIPYIAMMLATIKDFEFVYVEDVFRVSVRQLLEGSYLVFLFLAPLFYSLFLIGEKEKNYGRNVVKTILCSIGLSALILFLSYVLLVGNFGENALAKMRFPVVTIMSTIQFKGNFLKRMDALMLGVWFFTLYALLNLHLHYGVLLLKDAALKENKNQKAKQEGRQTKWWQLVVPSVLVFGIAYVLQQYEDGIRLFLNYYAYVAVPIMVVLPLVFVIVGRKNKSA